MDITKTVRNIVLAFAAVTVMACNIRDSTDNRTKETLNRLSKDEQAIVLKADSSKMSKSVIMSQAELMVHCNTLMKKIETDTALTQKNLLYAGAADVALLANKMTLLDDKRTLNQYKSLITLFDTKHIDEMIAVIDKLIAQIEKLER